MLNAEKYKEIILDITNNGYCIAVTTNDEVKKCCDISCSNCNFQKGCCLTNRYNWLLSEYKEPVKLSKQEKAFLDYAKSGYIARGKSGILFLYETLPERDDYIWSCSGTLYKIKTDLFQFIQWEDEPYSVEELLENGDVEE